MEGGQFPFERKGGISPTIDRFTTSLRYVYTAAPDQLFASDLRDVGRSISLP